MANVSKGVAVETAHMGGASTHGRSSDSAARKSELISESLQAETLSSHQFLKQLHVEKRRTDRTQSPLSLVIVRAHAEGGGGFGTIADLLDLVARNKRETDILGHVAKDCIGLLLPHTDERGVQAFIANISKCTARLPVSFAAGTYPDNLFDSLAGELRDLPDTLTFMFEERTELGHFAASVKRGVDIVGALTGLVLLSPVMLVTAVVIATTSPGPIIFRQTRLGKGGAPFVFYKFRSMKTDADDRIHREYVANLIKGNLEEINQGDEDRPLYKMSADPRVTAVGRFIRKTSLDELPQLLNVLKGDMSLVGPRPPLPYEAEKYQPWHLRRVLQARPGITGLWQVEGRSTTSFDEMVRLDLRYIRSCSLWLDLKILLKTVKVVLRRNGAG